MASVLSSQKLFEQSCKGGEKVSRQKGQGRMFQKGGLMCVAFGELSRSFPEEGKIQERQKMLEEP